MRPELLNPLVLAYIGDAVFEVKVREYLVLEKEVLKPDLLQKEAIRFVSAKAQAAFMNEAIEKDWLSEKEIGIYKRGRNAKNNRVMKNTSIADHNRSSGFEAIIGHLSLEEDMNRINEIFEKYKEFIENN